jgi:hypothetical protein
MPVSLSSSSASTLTAPTRASSTFVVGTDLPEGVHTVRLELLADPIDKAAVLAKNKNQIDKPERFAPLHFFPGALLILGELVP